MLPPARGTFGNSSSSRRRRRLQDLTEGSCGRRQEELIAYDIAETAREVLAAVEQALGVFSSVSLVSPLPSLRSFSSASSSGVTLGATTAVPDDASVLHTAAEEHAGTASSRSSKGKGTCAADQEAIGHSDGNNNGDHKHDHKYVKHEQELSSALSCCTAADSSSPGRNNAKHESTTSTAEATIRQQAASQAMLVEWSERCRVGDELVLLGLSQPAREMVRDMICTEPMLALAVRWESRGSQFAAEPRHQRQLVLPPPPHVAVP